MAESKEESPQQTDSPMQGLDVEPANATVFVGGTQQYTATAQYLDGTTADVTAQTAWVVYPSELGAIDPTGVLTAGAVGDGAVYATYAGVQSGTNIVISVMPSPETVHGPVPPDGKCLLCGWTFKPANPNSTTPPEPHIVHVPGTVTP